jgi:hypothetical protein
MAAGLCAAGPELTHYAGQTLGPVTRAKRLVAKGDPHNEHFFVGVGAHGFGSKYRQRLMKSILYCAGAATIKVGI